MKKLLAPLLALLLLLTAGCSGLGGSGEKEEVWVSSESSSELISQDAQLSSEPESAAESEPESTAEPGPESTAEPESSGSEPEPSVNADDELLILVNAQNHIPDDFTLELDTVQGNYKMNALAAAAARELIAAAAADGYTLAVCSGYRTVETSERLYGNKVQAYINAGWGEEAAKAEAAKWVAPPGTSEHHTGLAMDIVSGDYFSYYPELEHDFEKFDEFTWLYEHCADHGFILRYPKDKQDVTGITYEPWHYRYVGVENARAIMDAGLCLEEYVQQ